MRSQRKYFGVNWVDGMKINKDHFIAQDNALNDTLNDATSINLSPIRFGVMPPSAAGENTFNVTLSVDNLNTLKATVISLQAITSGGVRINYPALAQSEMPISTTFPFTATNSESVYWVVINMLPHKRLPVGSPDAAESPARFPFVQMDSELLVISDSQYVQYAYHPHALIIGKVSVNGNTIKVEDDYIPPCIAVNASPDLMGLHAELDQFFATMEMRCAQIVQKIFRRSQQNDLSELAQFLCDRIMLYIGQSLTDLRWSQLYESPAKMFSTVVGLARVMKNTIDLRIGSGKDELMNYLSEWCELNQGELENMLSRLTAMQYNHNDVNGNIGPIIHFAKVTGKLFESLSNLEFIGKRKESGIFVKEEHNYTQQNNQQDQPKPKRRFFG